MPFHALAPFVCHRFLQASPAPLPLVGGDVLVVHEIRRYADIHRSLCRVLHAYHAVSRHHPSALVADSQASAEFHLAFQSLMRRRHALKRHRAVLALYYHVVVRRREMRGERDAAWARCRQPYLHHVVVERCHRLAPVPHAVHRIFRHGNGRIQRQIPLVVAVRPVARHCQVQVAESLIRHSVVRARHQMLLRHLLRRGISPVEHHLAHLRQPLLRTLVHVRVRLSRPYRLFVQLHTLSRGDAIHHSPQPSVAQRQSLCPYLGRRRIPQTVARAAHSLRP